MPRVTLVFCLLLAAQATLALFGVDGASPFRGLIDGLATLSGLLAAGYYLPKAVRWLWRKILWRVRRRLVITYLFVGLTPIVLMSSLGILAGFVASAEGMAAAVRQELRSIETQAAASAKRIALRLASLDPAGGGPAAVVAREGAALRDLLPGARLEAWTSGTDAAGAPASAVSLPDGADARPLGGDDNNGAPLPSWLGGGVFQGLVFVPPADDSTRFGAGTIRAIAREGGSDRAVTVLVSVPMSRSLVTRLRDASHVEAHPYFDRSRVKVKNSSIDIPEPERPRVAARRASGARLNVGGEEIAPGAVDQLGEPVPDVPYPVIVSATDWSSGESEDRVAFLFPWSWSQAASQILGGTEIGRIWKIALVAVGSVFLLLELTALVAAVLITREVTGTVHELHLATEAVRRGDFTHRARKTSHDQLGELADAFNDMAGHIGDLLDERVVRERLEREVEIAAEVQSKLFPRTLPALFSSEITGECRAARGVAGDYYDYISVAPGLVAIALADVSGKGISASLLMSNLQASLRAQAGTLGEEPAPQIIPAGGALGAKNAGAVAMLAARLNAQLCRATDINRYATLFLALYDETSKVLKYTNAGHNAAILVQEDGSMTRLSRGGTIVGAFEGASYEEAGVVLSRGAILVVFSDGISEAANAAGDEFGEDRIAAFAVENRHRTADQIRDGIFLAVDAWSEGTERNDDQTLVVLRDTGATGAR